jgi:hypothetical protein
MNNNWIPVVERLPYKEEFLDEFNNTKELFITTDDGAVMSAEFNGDYFYTTHRLSCVVKENAIAWMGLPYKYEKNKVIKSNQSSIRLERSN